MSAIAAHNTCAPSSHRTGKAAENVDERVPEKTSDERECLNLHAVLNMLLALYGPSLSFGRVQTRIQTSALGKYKLASKHQLWERTNLHPNISIWGVQTRIQTSALVNYKLASKHQLWESTHSHPNIRCGGVQTRIQTSVLGKYKLASKHQPQTSGVGEYKLASKHQRWENTNSHPNVSLGRVQTHHCIPTSSLGCLSSGLHPIVSSANIKLAVQNHAWVVQ